jgi:hypothetical protein
MALGATPAVAGDATAAAASWRRRALYVLGSTAGGAAIFGLASVVLGLIAPAGVWWIAAGCVAGAYLVAAAVRHPLRVPERSWQVPKRWYTRAGDVAFVAYGAVLGVGVLTPIVFPTFYVLLLLSATLEPAVAAMLGAGYGALRGAVNSRIKAGPEQLPRLLGRHRTHQLLSSAALVLVAAFVLAGCGDDSAPEAPQAAAPATRAAADRPLDIPRIAAGARCPISRVVPTHPDFGQSLGDGPLYPVIVNKGVLRVVRARPAAGAANPPPGSYIQKVMWVASPDFDGTARIRGHGRDGDNDVWFRLNGEISEEMVLRSTDGGATPSGWQAWAASTLVAKPGCYAYQVDGPDFHQLITFRAVLGK